MEAIHAVNAPLWQPGEQTQIGQTDKPTDYYNPLAAVWPRVNNGIQLLLNGGSTSVDLDECITLSHYNLESPPPNARLWTWLKTVI